ncbi:TPA: hypothetical protein RTG63_001671, partial [Campylobacter jejuni]|nr:hypothetical protein [Campylobacter jejuni]
LNMGELEPSTQPFYELGGRAEGSSMNSGNYTCPVSVNWPTRAGGVIFVGNNCIFIRTVQTNLGRVTDWFSIDNFRYLDYEKIDKPSWGTWNDVFYYMTPFNLFNDKTKDLITIEPLKTKNDNSIYSKYTTNNFLVAKAGSITTWNNFIGQFMLPYRICKTIPSNHYIEVRIDGRSAWGSNFIKVPGHICFFWDDERPGGQGYTTIKLYYYGKDFKPPTNP